MTQIRTQLIYFVDGNFKNADITNYILAENFPEFRKTIEDDIFSYVADSIQFKIYLPTDRDLFFDLFRKGGIYKAWIVMSFVDFPDFQSKPSCWEFNTPPSELFKKFLFIGQVDLSRTEYDFARDVLTIGAVSETKNWIEELKDSPLPAWPRNWDIMTFSNFLSLLFQKVEFHLPEDIWISKDWYLLQQTGWEVWERDFNTDRGLLASAFDLLWNIAVFFGLVFRVEPYVYFATGDKFITYHKIKIMRRDLWPKLEPVIKIYDAIEFKMEFEVPAKRYCIFLTYADVERRKFGSTRERIEIPWQAVLYHVEKDYAIAKYSSQGGDAGFESILDRLDGGRDLTLDLRPYLPYIHADIPDRTRGFGATRGSLTGGFPDVFDYARALNDMKKVPFGFPNFQDRNYDINYIKQVYGDLFEPRMKFKITLPDLLPLEPLDVIAIDTPAKAFTPTNLAYISEVYYNPIEEKTTIYAVLFRNSIKEYINL